MPDMSVYHVRAELLFTDVRTDQALRLSIRKFDFSTLHTTAGFSLDKIDTVHAAYDRLPLYQIL